MRRSLSPSFGVQGLCAGSALGRNGWDERFAEQSRPPMREILNMSSYTERGALEGVARRLTLCCAVGLVLAFVTMLRGDEPVPPWSAHLTSGGPVRVALSPPDDLRFAHLSWPKVIRTAKGTIVLACVAGIFHGDNGGGSPAVSVSEDEGRSFSPPRVLRAFGPGQEYTQCGNLALGVANDGSISLLAMAYTGNERNNIYGWRSADEGKTWAPVDTSKLGPNKTGSVFGAIIDTNDLGLIVAGHFRKGSKPIEKGIWWASSTDNGLSWCEPKLVTAIEGYEPALVQSGNRLLIFIRNNTEKESAQYVSVSDDRGKTWNTERSEIKPIDYRTHALISPFAVNNPERPGELLLLGTERGRGASPGRIVLWQGDAQRLDWKRDRILMEFPRIPGDKHIDYGYPWLLRLSAHHWLMFYYHGLGHGPNSIWCADLVL